MARDAEIATYLRTDATLTGILEGGIYAESEIGGLDGFSRDDDSPTEDAFDSDGFLLPCAMVRDRAVTPFGDLRDLKEKKAGISQVSEVYYYQDRGRDKVDAAKERVYALMEGHAFDGAYPARWVLETPPVPDAGPLKGSTALRQDWQIIEVRG